MPLTLRVWTAIACMDQPDHFLQRDHRSPCQRHRLTQRPLAHQALMLTWSIPASTHLGIRSAPFHGRPLCLSQNALLVSPFLFYLMSPDASFAHTEKKPRGARIARKPSNTWQKGISRFKGSVKISRAKPRERSSSPATWSPLKT